MICPNCHSFVPATAERCPTCGQPLTATSEPPGPPAGATPPPQEPRGPSPEVPGPGTAPPPGATPPGQTGLDPHVAAGLAYLFSFLGGIVFLLTERNPLVRFAAVQSIGVFLVYLVLDVAYSLVFSLITAVLSLTPTAFPVAAIVLTDLWRLVGLAFLILWVVLVVTAFQGRTVRLPVLAGIADRYAAS